MIDFASLLKNMDKMDDITKESACRPLCKYNYGYSLQQGRSDLCNTTKARQVRRAKANDQLELLKWLVGKFPIQAKEFISK
jgi:hypothetical protein